MKKITKLFRLNNYIKALKIYLNIAFLFTAFILILNTRQSYCQNSQSLDYEHMTNGPNSIGLENLPPYPLNYTIQSGKLFFHLNLLELNGIYKLQECDFDCDLYLDFTLQGIPYSYLLKVDNNNPEELIVLDITDLNLNNLDFVLSTGIVMPPSQCDAQNKIKLDIKYEVKYSTDVISGYFTPTLVVQPIEIIEKKARISWQSIPYGLKFPGYQLQVLKLFNESSYPVILENEGLLSTTFSEKDWDNAFDIFIESSQNFYEMTLSEDEGFYVCRVRPIGNYYEGGFANSKNYSDNQWSFINYPSSNIIELNADNISAPYFYYTNDPDKYINWIYSRIFTEGNNVSEQITYATSLNNIKQSQKFLPSVDKNVVTQNIYDYSGRNAISTLGIPVEGGITGYKSSFITTADGNLYNPEHFDTEGNILKPAKTSEVGDLSYYSTNNTSINQVPSAEGYPYSRTIFAPDATGRIIEQSGPGYANALHDASGNLLNRRTIKTFYGKATEQELIKVFGAEAPKGESVFKTIVIDQNNIVTITYTDNSGKILASCLSNNNFNVQDAQLTDLDSENTTPILIEDKINLNIKTKDGYISSQRIFIDQEDSELKLAYIYNCDQVNLKCGSANVDCGFYLYLSLSPVNDSVIIWEKRFENKLVCGEQISIEPIFNLPIGEYVIVKKLTYDPNAVTTQYTPNAENSVNPILNWITSQIETVYDEAQQRDFYTLIIKFSDDLNNCVSNNQYPVCQELLQNYIGLSSDLNLSADHEMYLLRIENPNTGSMVIVTESYINGLQSFDKEIFYIYLKTDCCNGFYIPCIFEGKYKCDATHPPKFEQYLKDISPLNTNIYTTYLPGYDSTEFDALIANMAILDNYNIYDGTGSHVQYDCEELWNAWVMVTSAYSKFDESGLHGGNYNISDSVDVENGGSKDVHDNHFDKKSNFKGRGGFFMRWLVKRKLSKLARDRSSSISDPPSNNVNLVEDFFNLVGHRFTRPLITGQPMPADYNPNRTYYTGPNTLNPHLYIKDRLKAHKYYQYTRDSKKACEILNCFANFDTDPPFCQEVPVCGTTNVTNWDYQHISSFFDCLTTLQNHPPDSAAQMTCGSINLDSIYMETMDLCYGNCEENYLTYRNYIADVFRENCYEIDGCETNINSVASATIDSLARFAVKYCKSQYCDQFDRRELICKDIKCKDIFTGKIIEYFPKIVIPDCELMFLQVSEWDLELGVLNMCGANNNPLCNQPGNLDPTVENDCDNPTMPLDNIKKTNLKYVIVTVSNGQVTVNE